MDNEQYFNRGTVYGEWDDGERFGFFQMAALELMEKWTLFQIFSMFMTTTQP
ncbi:MAG: glycogen/starch synthase [Streptococcus sp.]